MMGGKVMLSEVKVEVGSQRSLKAYVGHEYDAQRVISKKISVVVTYICA